MLLNCGVGEDSWDSWTARISNQSILKEISPECSLERLMLKLKLQYFGLLMKVKEESEKVGLKLNIQKMKIKASGPITSWQIDGETVKTVAEFILGGSKITADGDCSHESKRCLLLGKKVMTNLDSILKSRDITWLTKVHLVKAMVFPIVMYACESSTVKKAEHRRIDAFELWCWRRLLSPLDCKCIKPVNPKGNQSWIFTGRTDAETETLDSLAIWCEELT